MDKIYPKILFFSKKVLNFQIFKSFFTMKVENIKKTNNIKEIVSMTSKISPGEEWIRNINSSKLITKILYEISEYEYNSIKQDLGSRIRFNLVDTIYDILRNNYEAINGIDIELNYNNIDLEKNIITEEYGIAKTPKDILDIFNLRYIAFKKRNYNNLIGDELKEIKLNFDIYDKNSILLYYKRDNKITASSRLVLDSYINLPSEYLFDKKNGFNNLREFEKNNLKGIAEISRSVIDPKFQARGNEFKTIFGMIYKLSKPLEIGSYITAIAKEDFKLYEKAGFKIIKEGIGYNEINRDVLYLSWDVKKVNSFFKRAFLK